MRAAACACYDAGRALLEEVRSPEAKSEHVYTYDHGPRGKPMRPPARHPQGFHGTRLMDTA
eukprot:5539157-Pyramimonas_sp.AAC.1